jgi:hypothetical protein
VILVYFAQHLPHNLSFLWRSGSPLAMSIVHVQQRRAFYEIPGVCWQVASEHVPKGGNDYVTIAYVPLKGEQ